MLASSSPSRPFPIKSALTLSPIARLNYHLVHTIILKKLHASEQSRSFPRAALNQPLASFASQISYGIRFMRSLAVPFSEFLGPPSALVGRLEYCTTLRKAYYIINSA